MLSIRNDFADRISEINIYFALMENIIDKEAQLIFPNDSDKRERFSLDLHGTLKSCAILLIYNLVESTVSKSIGHIHNVISSELIQYDDASDNIQKIWLQQYYDKFKETGTNEKNVLTNLKLLVDTLLKNNVPVQLSYGEKEKRSGETSGNLDSRKIKELSEKYGIDFDKSSTALKNVKDKRIELAHGIKSFLECCNTLSFQDIVSLKKESITFIEEFMDSVEKYIDNKKYKK